jgi:metal-sulfur cluster biosynthetic enzyme
MEIDLVSDPPWSRESMTRAAKAHFGIKDWLKRKRHTGYSLAGWAFRG